LNKEGRKAGRQEEEEEEEGVEMRKGLGCGR
jgi:hypothetical protein